MTPELEAKLVERFPTLFIGRTYPLTESLMGFGCECGDGWHTIIEDACEKIAKHCEDRGLNDFAFMQIKEKFGSLRMYANIEDGYIGEVIDTAESKSGETCERCGDAGTQNSSGYWISTLCERCRQT
jgi:hypothetical protein